MHVREAVRDALDAGLEFSVVGSFSRLGVLARRRLYAWPRDYDRIGGRVAVVTGASSGLGRETAATLAGLGAHVIMVVRDLTRGVRVRAEILARSPEAVVDIVVADMGDLDSVRAASVELGRVGPIDVLVHNAGSLLHERTLSPQGLEVTAAVHLVGPFLLTRLLEAQLEAAHARIIWVTSGGMYAQTLDVDAIEMRDDYDGVTAYARVKRAQVSLVARWAPELGSRGVTMVAVHPGWADTPGVQHSLPTFRRLMGPLLRTIQEGADTIVWLATIRDAPQAGGLWLDRRIRRSHRLARTRRTDTVRERERLWQYCLARSAEENFGDAAVR